MDEIATLQQFYEKARQLAESIGFEPGEVEFRVVGPERLYEMLAYGVPDGLAHWKFGRDYWRIRRQFDRGMGRIYEMIVNANPPVAFLLEGNTIAAQKLVIAHCLGHSDVYRHHLVFQETDRDMPNSMALARERFLSYESEYGEERVESTLDAALSLMPQSVEEKIVEETEEERSSSRKSGPFDALFTPPKPVSALSEEERRELRRYRQYNIPTADLLGFLGRHSAILEEWQRDIVLTVRRIALYFAPQSQVKMIHEGFATVANQKILSHPECPMTAGEQIESAVLFGNVAQPDPLRLNPYWFGWKFFTWLEQQYGFARARQIFMEETDASLIRNWLTREAFQALELYLYRWVPTRASTMQEDAVQMDLDWEVARDILANSWSQQAPQVAVVDVDREGMLCLEHVYDGEELDPVWTDRTLEAVKYLWGGGVVFREGKAPLVK